MSRALIGRGRWLSKRALATQPLSRAVVSTCDGSVENLPLDDNSFDKALAINSMQVWPDAEAGLREVRRVMKPGGGIALGFTPYSWQPNKGLTETLSAAGFTKAHVVETSKGFCALATRP
jgi:ubiquinone/menaquinone biosynthesis C-methylase UbiE